MCKAAKLSRRRFLSTAAMALGTAELSPAAFAKRGGAPGIGLWSTSANTDLAANSGVQTVMTPSGSSVAFSSGTSSTAIRPFHVDVPEKQLVDLRQRLAATRWPGRETVSDQSQGVPLATMQELVRYWGNEYDWRKAEARLNALPQFVTAVDGLDIYFIQVRSRHANALPLIVTHGWPGSIFELLNIVGPLTDPPAYGGRAEDAFDVVIPSMPGFGFSDKPQQSGWDPDHIARAWDVLMKRLGYTRYVSQGGDWGALIAEVMGRQAPTGLLGIHINYPATVPSDIAKAIAAGEPAPAGLTPEEKAAFDSLGVFLSKHAGYRVI
jgi:pimeloyl-ACP methyl ester carboxylesterase